MNAPQATHTIRSFLNELDLAGRRYKKRLNGHRDQLYSSMQTAQHVIVECLKNEALQSEFVRAVQGEKKKKGGKRLLRFNLSLEAMALSTGASDTQARKIASKRAGVLDLLRERRVRVRDTAETIKKLGIEKLYSEKPKKKSQKEARQREGKAEQTGSSPIGRGLPRSGLNDRETYIGFWMKQSDKDQLLESKFDTMLTVLVSRVSEDDGDIQVRRVVSGNHLSDWED
jgi:hypothetical protein